ncbi:MAG: Hpt domain-containing protein, partial [Bacteroidota bacterium]
DFNTYLHKDSLEMLVDLMDGDVEMIVDLVDTLIDTTPDLLDDLQTGVASKNANQIRNAAHALKSSNKQLGAYDFADMCETMESKGRANDTADLDILLDKILQEFEKVKEALGGWKNSLA